MTNEHFQNSLLGWSIQKEGGAACYMKAGYNGLPVLSVSGFL